MPVPFCHGLLTNWAEPADHSLAVSDMAGAVVGRISYSSYGRATFTDGQGRPCGGPSFGPAGNPLHTSAVAWQGLPVDLETGLSYNRARSLHHRLGRFLQRDPLGYVDGMGLYEYVGSGPINDIDPAGLFPWGKAWEIIGGVGKGAKDFAIGVGGGVIGSLDPVRLGCEIGKDIGNTYCLARNDGCGKIEAVAGTATVTAGKMTPIPSFMDAKDAADHDDLEGIARGITKGILESLTWVVGAKLAKGGLGGSRWPFGKKSGPTRPPIKPGSQGGATAGKVFPESAKQQALAENPSRTCVFCGRGGTATQVDHAIPRARGGNATIDNAQLACPHCNASKGARNMPVTPPHGYEGPWPPQ